MLELSNKHVVFVTKFVAELIIKDKPLWVSIAQKREIYQARAIIEGLTDNHYMNAVENELTDHGRDAGPENTREQMENFQNDERLLRQRTVRQQGDSEVEKNGSSYQYDDDGGVVPDQKTPSNNGANPTITNLILPHTYKVSSKS
eukprot:gene8430-7766_t